MDQQPRSPRPRRTIPRAPSRGPSGRTPRARVVALPTARHGQAPGPAGLPLTREDGLRLLALCAFSLLLYAHSLGFEFTFDDRNTVLADPALRTWHFFDLWSGWSRGVRTLTLIADHALFGLRPAGYHLHNLLWNAAAVGLLYALVRRISGQPWLAFVAALLFAAHPIHVEAVANVTNRKEMLCFSFCVLALLAYARFLETGRGRTGWLLLSGAAWLAALFSKQVAIALPLSCVAYEALFTPRHRRVLATGPGLALLALAGFLAAAFAPVVLDLAAIRQETFKGFEGRESAAAAALTSARAFWRYVALFVWPSGLCPDHRVALSGALLEPRTALAWLGLAGFVALSVASARRSPVLAFGLLWWLVHFLPVSNLVRASYIVADRYQYIPSAGLCIAFAWVAAAGHERLRLRRPGSPTATAAVAVAVGVAVSACALRTLDYSRVWSSEASLWQYTLACNPRSFRAHNGLGNHYFRERAYEPALAHLSQAIALGMPLALFNRGNVYFALERWDEALEDYTRSIEQTPGWVPSHFNRGNTRLRLGAYEAAIADFDRALALDPRHAGAYNNRGWAHAQLGRAEAAVQDYHRALAVSPDRPDIQMNLGRALARQGDREAARTLFERAAALGERDAAEALRSLDAP